MAPHIINLPPGEHLIDGEYEAEARWLSEDLLVQLRGRVTTHPQKNSPVTPPQATILEIRMGEEAAISLATSIIDLIQTRGLQLRQLAEYLNAKR